MNHCGAKRRYAIANVAILLPEALGFRGAMASTLITPAPSRMLDLVGNE